NPARNGEIKERILGTHIVYVAGPWELLSEYANIRHEDHVSSRTFTTNGYYAQAAYQFPRLKPYYRYDFINYAEGDPFYAPAPIGIDVKKHTLGLRYDPILWLGFKFEYSNTRLKGSDRCNSFTIQSAFTF